MVKIGVLTSSRADFGVYIPLLNGFKESLIDFELIVFGTHLSRFHGYTINEIEQEGFIASHTIETTLASDSEYSISSSASLTCLKFSEFWQVNKTRFDLIFCLGDRYEMFSAVIAGVPYGIKFAHLYGGDYSEGAIDNVYRNGLTHCSKIHFTSTEVLCERIKQMVNNYEHVESVGILSLNSLLKTPLLTPIEFRHKWGIDLTKPSVLVTLHPETIDSSKNECYADIIVKVLGTLSRKYLIIITLPNSDTNGIAYRKKFATLQQKFPNIYLIENFGLHSYFTCMNYTSLIIGNSSSGISEAASFRKYVIDVGNRQKGRLKGENIFSVEFKYDVIIKTIKSIENLDAYSGNNIYFDKRGVQKIINFIKDKYFV